MWVWLAVHLHFLSLSLSQDDVLSEFFKKRDLEVERERSHDNQQHSSLVSTLQRWRGVRYFFTGERGAWSNRWVWFVGMVV